MSTLVRAAIRPMSVRGRVATDPEIRDAVRHVLATLYAGGQVVERRRDRRFPFPNLLYLSTLDEVGCAPAGAPLAAVGKTLSEGGLGFFHPAPLAHRRMIVSLESAPGQWTSLLTDLTWCRFTRFGWYESGGRFLRVVRLPPNSLARAASGVEYQI